MSDENQITKFINLLEEMGVDHEVHRLSGDTLYVSVGGEHETVMVDFYFNDAGKFKSID